MATSSDPRRDEVSERDIDTPGSFQEGEKNHANGDRFVGNSDTLEETLKKQTIGLVRLEDFQKRRADLEEEKRRHAAQTNELKPEERKKKKKKSRHAKTSLSFADEDQESVSQKRQKVGPRTEEAKKVIKNPSVDTSFLPDRQREEEERKIREALRQKWLQKQATMKEEEIEITYSYWDGSGHRKEVKCKKGDTIAHFLDRCRQQFPELRRVHVDDLLFVKEDLIIPHNISFYDLIVSKSRGKSGPLFNFTAHDDVRLLADATVEKDDSHAGKVVERNWYNRNKHIFPASRWEVFELGKDYGGYTIRDTKK